MGNLGSGIDGDRCCQHRYASTSSQLSVSCALDDLFDMYYVCSELVLLAKRPLAVPAGNVSQPLRVCLMLVASRAALHASALGNAPVLSISYLRDMSNILRAVVGARRTGHAR